MKDAMLDKILALWKIARYDPKCCEIGKRYDELEDAFAAAIKKLSREEQDIVWGYVCTSDELDCRLMELMCECFDLDPVGYLEKLERGQNAGGDRHTSLRTGSQ